MRLVRKVARRIENFSNFPMVTKIDRDVVFIQQNLITMVSMS